MPDWDELAATWEDRDETHVYARQALATLEPFVTKHLGGFEGKRLLDFGAGTGLLVDHLAPKCREIVALDLSATAPAEAEGELASIRERMSQQVLAADRWGAEVATQGSLHDSVGVMTYVLGCAVLLGVGTLLRRYVPDGGLERTLAAR